MATPAASAQNVGGSTTNPHRLEHLNRLHSLHAKIMLTDGARTVIRTREELEIRIVSEKPVRLSADVGALKAALTRLAPKFAQAATDARPYVYKGAVHLAPGADARALNVPTTAQRLAEALGQNPALSNFTVTLEKKPPVLTAARLQGITGVLGTMTTNASPNANRNNNIGLAVQRINGTLLSPGEIFSLNQTVGKRSPQSGFEKATVFINAQKAKDYGGGVSQVTGTLFNAAALAGLKILEVNPHSRPVAYLPVGRDATVAYGEKDLKFKNDTSGPVYISYTFSRNRLSATLFAKKVPGRTVTLKPDVQHLGPGKVNATLYRVIKERGKTIEKAKIYTHAYRWTPST